MFKPQCSRGKSIYKIINHHNTQETEAGRSPWAPASRVGTGLHKQNKYQCYDAHSSASFFFFFSFFCILSLHGYYLLFQKPEARMLIWFSGHVLPSSLFPQRVYLRNTDSALALLCHFIYQLHMAFQQQNTPSGRQTEAHTLMPEFILSPNIYLLLYRHKLCPTMRCRWCSRCVVLDLKFVRKKMASLSSQVKRIVTPHPTRTPFVQMSLQTLSTDRPIQPLLSWPGMLLEPFCMLPFLFGCIPELNI